MRRGKHLWKLLAALLALSMVAAACGNDDDTAETTTTTAADTTDTTEADDSDEPSEPGEVTLGPGVTEDTITLGVITPQTGPAAVIGNPLTAGNQVFFDALNAEGGIAGQYQVVLKVEDSQYQPPVAVQQYNSAKNDVAAFVQILGTAVTNAVLPQLVQDNMLGSPASLDAFWQEEEHLLPIGGPYQIQVINGLDWYYQQPDAGETLCVLHQEDPYGEAGLEGAKAYAEEAGIDIAVSAAFRQGDQDFTAQLQQLQNNNCEVVVLTSLPTETAQILGASAGAGYTPQWLGQSPTWVAALASSPLADYMSANFLLMSEGAPWGDESVPGMAKMLADIEQFKPDQAPDIYFAFGYAQAWAMAQLLEKAVELGDLSRDGIMAAAAVTQTLSFEELLGESTYGLPDERDPSRATSIFKVDPSAPGGLAAASDDSINYVSSQAENYVIG